MAEVDGPGDEMEAEEAKIKMMVVAPGAILPGIRYMEVGEVGVEMEILVRIGDMEVGEEVVDKGEVVAVVASSLLTGIMSVKNLWTEVSPQKIPVGATIKKETGTPMKEAGPHQNHLMAIRPLVGTKNPPLKIKGMEVLTELVAAGVVQIPIHLAIGMSRKIMMETSLSGRKILLQGALEVIGLHRKLILLVTNHLGMAMPETVGHRQNLGTVTPETVGHRQNLGIAVEMTNSRVTGKETQITESVAEGGIPLGVDEMEELVVVIEMAVEIGNKVVVEGVVFGVGKVVVAVMVVDEGVEVTGIVGLVHQMILQAMMVGAMVGQEVGEVEVRGVIQAGVEVVEVVGITEQPMSLHLVKVVGNLPTKRMVVLVVLMFLGKGSPVLGVVPKGSSWGNDGSVANVGGPSVKEDVPASSGAWGTSGSANAGVLGGWGNGGSVANFGGPSAIAKETVSASGGGWGASGSDNAGGWGSREGHRQRRLFQLRVVVGVQAVLIMHLDGDKILAKAKIKVAALEGGNYCWLKPWNSSSFFVINAIWTLDCSSFMCR